MILRELELSDSKEMLEWMHDNEVIGLLPTHFNNMSIRDCQDFITNARSNKKDNVHFAVSNEKNEYLGTISLKNIDYINKNAEYAIVLGKKAIGTGIAQKATFEILSYGFKKLELEKVYLCVFKDNKRAVKFYNKFGFRFEGEFRKHLYGANDNVRHDLQWYGILKDEFEKMIME